MRGRRWRMGLAAALAATRLGGSAHAATTPVVGHGRRVLGSMQTAGRVEGSIDGVRWLPLYPGAAVLDGMQLRVPGDGAATLQLAGGDQLMFERHSEGEIGNGDAVHVRLDHGRLRLRLRPASRLVAEAGRGIVRTVAGKPTRVDAILTCDGLGTTLASQQGVLELRAAGTDTGTLVEKGHQASVGQSGPASAASPIAAENGDGHAGAGALGIAGLSTGAAIAMLGGVAAVGVGVGAAAGSGSFSGDGSSTPDATDGSGREGSPFRPVLR